MKEGMSTYITTKLTYFTFIFITLLRMTTKGKSKWTPTVWFL